MLCCPVPQLGPFDGIFFDTYGEYYEVSGLVVEHGWQWLEGAPPLGSPRLQPASASGRSHAGVRSHCAPLSSRCLCTPSLTPPQDMHDFHEKLPK